MNSPSTTECKVKKLAIIIKIIHHHLITVALWKKKSFWIQTKCNNIAAFWKLVSKYSGKFGKTKYSVYLDKTLNFSLKKGDCIYWCYQAQPSVYPFHLSVQHHLQFQSILQCMIWYEMFNKYTKLIKGWWHHPSVPKYCHWQKKYQIRLLLRD